MTTLGIVTPPARTGTVDLGRPAAATSGQRILSMTSNAYVGQPRNTYVPPIGKRFSGRNATFLSGLPNVTVTVIKRPGAQVAVKNLRQAQLAAIQARKTQRIQHTQPAAVKKPAVTTVAGQTSVKKGQAVYYPKARPLQQRSEDPAAAGLGLDFETKRSSAVEPVATPVAEAFLDIASAAPARAQTVRLAAPETAPAPHSVRI